MPRKLEVLVVDDHQVVREGLKRILEQSGDCLVAAEAASVRDALQWLRRRSFDLALLDIALPEQTGLDLLRSIKRERPMQRTLMLSAYREEHYAVRAFKDGADGYLNKECAPSLLLAAIRKVVDGGKYMSPMLAERIAEELTVPNEGPLHAQLSPRELEVMKLIARGTSLKQVGDRLHISAKTVTTYRARIMQKTGLSNNAELTRYLLENDLLD